MILLIDAYNILKRIYLGQYVSENQKGLFVNQLIKYCAVNKNNKAIVVFDGGANLYPDIEARACVTVVHSGNRLTADEYIKEYIEKNSNKAEFLLVSSDRDLKNHARKFNVEAIGGYEFYQLLTQDETKSYSNFNIIQKFIKEDEAENLELDKLMEQSGNIKFNKIEDSGEVARVSNPKKPSKEERKIIKIVKKL